MRSTSALAAATAVMLVLISFPHSSGAAPSLSSAGTQTGTAACYSKRLRGHRTFSGQRYNPDRLTAAHAKIPIGSRIKVTNLANSRSVVLTVNDRMSAHAGGIITDISQHACRQLKFPRTGEARVRIEVLGSTRSAKAN